jgi:predicted Fe-Mo cluster-binding NifX family protein
MRVISLSFFFNAISVVIKGAIGFLGGSHALVADALHSLTDTASFGINYYGVRNTPGSTPAISAKQTALIGALTLLTGVCLCGHNLSILIIGKTVRPGLLGIIVSLASIVLGWHLYQLSRCANERFKDIHIFVCKVQNRTNLAFACLSLAGVVLADLGFLFADPLAAVVIGCLMAGAAVEIFITISASDTAISPVSLTRIKQLMSLAIVGIIVFFFITTVMTIESKHVVLIPSEGTALDSRVDKFLGRARYFIIYNEKENRIFPVFNTDTMISGDVSHNLVSIVQRNGVDVVLAGTIGYEMYQDLKALNVDIYYLKERGPVHDAYLDYKDRKVKSALGPNVDRGFGRSGVGWMRPW